MTHLADCLAALPALPGTVLHLGAGDGAVLQDYLGTDPRHHPRQLLLLEGDADTGADLRDALREAARDPAQSATRLQLLPEVVSADGGRHTWRRHNLRRLNGPLALPGAEHHYPSLRTVEQREVPTVALVQLLHRLAGQGLLAPTPGREHLLVLDLPGQAHALLASLPPALLRPFGAVLVTGWSEPDTPAGEQLQTLAFSSRLVAAGQDRLQPMQLLVFDPLREALGQAQSREQALQAEQQRLQAELQEQTRLAQGRRDQLDELRRQLRAQQAQQPLALAQALEAAAQAAAQSQEAALREQAEAITLRLQAAMAQDLAQQQAQARQQLDQAQAEAAQQLATLQAEHKRQTDLAQAEAAQQLATLQAEHKRQTDLAQAEAAQQLATLQAEHKRQTDLAQARRTQLDTLRETLRTTQQELARSAQAQQAEVQTRQAAEQALAQAQAELRAQALAALAQHGQHEQALAQWTQERAALQDTAQAAAAQAEDRARALQAELRQQTELAGARRTQLDALREELRTAVRGHGEQLAALQAECDQRGLALQRTQAQAQEAQEARQALDTLLAQVRAELGAATGREAALQAELGQQTELAGARRTQLDALREDKRQAEAQAQAQQQALHKELAEARQAATLALKLQTLREHDLADLQTRYAEALGREQGQQDLLVRLGQRLTQVSQLLRRVGLVEGAALPPHGA
ncbi:hypothetical protein [Ideonella livida]|uniref:Uncharacterized protein n=1 Tax=Ideonella livida TaxID=2707176 RepID=A0A7C9PJF4_9BURK|nr:hypothetical protein [Ideonella livida]NDY93413.1 hypothetical protein [Ideonella livida]